MYRLSLSFRIAVLISCMVIPSTATAYEVFIPHITGTGGYWQDYLQVDNNDASPSSFTLTIYDKGIQVYQDSFTVDGQGSSLMDLKTLVPYAESACGVITYDSELLYFRLSYEQRSGGGVAEFRLTDDLYPAIGFYFSDYIPEVSWKAIAVSNMNSIRASVKLYAVGNGGIIGCADVAIAPLSKEVGLYTKWFPEIGFDEIDAIFAVSTQDLCGVTISGNATQSFLLFTAAAEVMIADSLQDFVCPEERDDDGDGYSENQGDCNDADASVHPGSTEIADDGIDQDCDGKDLLSPENIDDDGDGYTENQGDCNDASASVHPGATDICGDGIDQDCSGADCKPADPGAADNDGDGYSKNQGDCNDANASVHPGATDICGDGIDQDCSGADCKPADPGAADNDGDGYSENQGDCNDADASVHPGAAEISNDGIDQDCNGRDLKTEDPRH